MDFHIVILLAMLVGVVVYALCCGMSDMARDKDSTEPG
jgi:hypothetical protein